MSNKIEGFTFSQEVGSSGESLEAVAVDALEQGYDAVHIFFKNGTIYYQCRFGAIPNGIPISSAEMGFRSEKNLFQWFWHPLPKGPLIAALAQSKYPERLSTLKALEHIQQYNPEVYLILYPYHARSLRNGERWNRHWNEQEYSQMNTFKHKLLFPAPELLDRWDVNGAQGLVDALLRHKFNGLALKVQHLIREPDAHNGFKSRFDPLKEILPVFIPHTEIIELHPVEPRNRITSLNDYLSAEEMYLIQLAKEMKWNGIVVVHEKGNIHANVQSDNVSPFLQKLKHFFSG